MSRYRKCSVKDCEDERSHRHLFPNPKKFPELFRKWIDICANDDLLKMDVETVYRAKRICHVHFTRNDISSNMFLKKGVIPSLQLPLRNNLFRIVIEKPSEDISSTSMSKSLLQQAFYTASQKGISIFFAIFSKNIRQVFLCGIVFELMIILRIFVLVFCLSKGK